MSFQTKYRWILIWIGISFLLFPPPASHAGANAFRTLVVVNTQSVDSVELGEYYAAAHGIPSHHICTVDFSTNLVSLTSNEFQSLLLTPIQNHLDAQDLNGQIDFLVLCQEFPTRVRNTEGIASALFYGYKNAPYYNENGIGCSLPDYTSNTYFRAERAFHSADGWNATNGFVAFHLIASNVETAKLVAARGAAAQSTFPASSINLYFSGDQARGIREQEYPDAAFSFTSLPGLPSTFVFPPFYAQLYAQTNVMGYHDGDPYPPPFVYQNNTFLSGAYADHLTSWGGMITNLTNETSQATVLDWMNLGATASYGTVAEPCAFKEKFPVPHLGFYYVRGFTIGEAYAMSVEAPYQGLFAGDPLAAPFAAPPTLSVTSHVPFQVVTSSISVAVSALPHPQGSPPASIDLYLDERFHSTLTSIHPTPGNVLSVAVAGVTNSAIVASNATLFDAVSALAETVNADSNSIVHAVASADRLELAYTNYDREADYAPVSATVGQGSADALTLGVGLAATHLFPSTYPARQFIYVRDNPYNGGANSGDVVTCVVTLTNNIAITNSLVASQGETRRSILERLMASIHSNETLMATNGVRYDRMAANSNLVVWFGSLFARTPGPEGANIHVSLDVAPVSTNSGLVTNFNFSGYMTNFPADLRSRASVLFHVTPSNGVLEAGALLDTTLLTDGVHVLDFVARDGSAVASASRFTLPLHVCNNSPVYWLEISADPNGRVDIPSSWQCGGSTVQVAALPDPYFTFLEWSGDASGSRNPLELVMDNAKSIHASFSPILATHATPYWWLAHFGWTNDFDAAALDDPDEDGTPTWQEYVADTDPTDANDVWLPLAVAGTTQLVFAIEPTSTGRLYSIDAAENLVHPIWSNLTNASGTGSPWNPEWTLPDTGVFFFRSRVHVPP